MSNSRVTFRWEDRISDLPDDVLVHILSFLTFKQAIRSSMLSRRWRILNPCLTCSNLNFTDMFFNIDPTDFYPNKSTRIRKKNLRSLNVVDKIIRRRKSHASKIVIENFSLTFSYSSFDTGAMNIHSMQSRFDRWINSLAKPSLVVLDLNVHNIVNDDYFSFPLAMLASETTSSLQVLSLVGFKFVISSPISVFSCLHSLSLKSVLFDNSVLETILKASPLLEELILSDCFGLTTLNIKGFLHLKKLELCRFELVREIDIHAPNLEVLIMICNPNYGLNINIASFLPCLKKFEFISFSRTTGLKARRVKFQGLQLPIDKFFHQIFTMCPLLEELKIDKCSKLQTINFSTTMYALKTLHLPRLQNMIKFVIIAPNLEKFYIDIFKNIPIVSLDASDKLDVTVRFHDHKRPYNQLVKFFGAFNPCRVIKIQFSGYKRFFIAKEKRNNLPSPLYGTKCLEFRTYQQSKRLSEHLDYMLWLSPQATNLKITSGFLEIVIECVYEKIGIDNSEAGDLCPCCKLIPITCWRHCLKEMRIQEFVGDEVEKANVISFFLEQVENLIIKEVPFDPDSIQGGLYAFYDE